MLLVNTQLGCCGRCRSGLSGVRRRRRSRSQLGELGNPLAIVGPIIGGLNSIISLIFGSHAAAVAKEANTLNSAVPAFVSGLQAILQAANQGQITAQQGQSLCDEAVQTYYQQVGSIMKKQGPCVLNPDCSYPGGNQPGNTTLNPCNGPCSVGCNFVEPSACLAKRVLATGGSVTTPSLNSHAGFQGQPAFTLTYQPPPVALPPSVLPPSVSNVVTPVQQAIAAAGLPSWFLPVAGGLLAAKLVGVI